MFIASDLRRNRILTYTIISRRLTDKIRKVGQNLCRGLSQQTQIEALAAWR